MTTLIKIFLLGAALGALSLAAATPCEVSRLALLYPDFHEEDAFVCTGVDGRVDLDLDAVEFLTENEVHIGTALLSKPPVSVLFNTDTNPFTLEFVSNDSRRLVYAAVPTTGVMTTLIIRITGPSGFPAEDSAPQLRCDILGDCSGITPNEAIGVAGQFSSCSNTEFTMVPYPDTDVTYSTDYSNTFTAMSVAGVVDVTSTGSDKVAFDAIYDTLIVSGVNPDLYMFIACESCSNGWDGTWAWANFPGHKSA